MNISVIGLGYVGCTMIACLSNNNRIYGVDINIDKIELLIKGKSSIFEPGINELLNKGINNGNIIATDDLKQAILNSDITFLTIGTPTNKDNGNLDLSQIYKVSKEIGSYIKLKNSFHTIVIRSTTTPGTNETVSKLIEDASGKIKDIDFTVVTNPEFLREGNAIYDFNNPEIILVGSNSEKAINILKELYNNINAEFIVTDINVAEIMKFVNNSYHALKVSFANEIGNICKSLNIDGNKVMNIFCKDKKLNISPYYFKPGFAYGGSCLSKDLGALKVISKNNNVNTPIINSIENSNNQHIEYAIKLIKSFNKKNIGILGLTFKSNTDDLRSSPILEVIKSLQDKSYNVCITDKILKNKENLNKINDLLSKSLFIENINDLINSNDVIVISNKEEEYKDLCNQYPNKIFVDLCGQFVNNDFPNVYSLSK